MTTEILLFATILLLGLRHGMDWDHLAAISDIAASERQPRRALVLGTLYALGHAAVVTLLGLLVVLLDVRLPAWVDALSEPLLGVTLVLLGAWVFYALLQGNTYLPTQSRWMVLFNLLRRGYYRARGQAAPPSRITYTALTAWVVGMIHGLGAETPTQLLLFAAAAGVTSAAKGVALVLIFVAGLVISNTVIILASTYTFLRAASHARFQTALMVLTGCLSMGLGLWVLTQVTGTWFLGL